MAINDFKCVRCAFIEENMLAKPDCCPLCGEKMEVTFEKWDRLEVDPRKDERTDSKGFVKAFSALDDPICAAQLGLGDSKLQSYCKLDSDEQKEFQGRLTKDGDSPKLRRDILRKYNSKIGNKYEMMD